MKKIGIFTGYFLPHLGGVERYTDKLSDELIKLGYEIKIITSNHDKSNNYEKGKITIYKLPIYNLFKQRYPILKKNREYKETINKIKREKLDFIICNTRFYLTTLVGLKIVNMNKIPCLIIEHGSDHFTVNNKILDFFGRVYEHFITKIIIKKTKNFYGVSDRCNNWLKHFKIDANGIFYNSVDGNDYKVYKTKKFDLSKKYEDKIIISFASRIIKEKGVIMILDAFTQLNKKYKNISLFIAGDGPLLSELKNKYNNKNIYFTGKITYNQIMSLFNMSDIFVHPSMFPEGLPTTILEAGLMKCAVIATDRGGTVEVINDDSCGIICKENTKDLKEKLEMLILNENKRTKLAENIHKRILNNFTWEVSAKKVAKELEKLKNEK